ncbi:hypothetical protein [Acinetobacter baumannii]|uniref:hypothetical protein n=2 Tax=Acinetobacter baumannii TaxID=470 RepID=UPI000DE6BA95|nr:hypothetical protein OCUAc18_09370 [Acinetobacter baumannii]SSP37495.1 Uncharacterised protein [Acinetobacter baumannii]SSQ37625.1 Uncharacterised protein [Acinetobacter baumannii]SSQ40483.1 Uncharacterised protein [Acinetobacter baumannii]SVJ96680.1 Uncharacterised protein [Acinetobacter baumannii]
MMFDLNKEREAFLVYLRTKGVIKVGWNSLGVLTNLVREAGCTLGYNDIELMQEVWMEKAKAQAVPTWISVDDEWPPTDIMVLICWADAPDVTPEQDYMTIDEDLNSVWANYQNDPPSHWMHFHSVPNVSGAEQ